jgi:hypothetical protein
MGHSPWALNFYEARNNKMMKETKKLLAFIQGPDVEVVLHPAGGGCLVLASRWPYPDEHNGTVFKPDAQQVLLNPPPSKIVSMAECFMTLQTCNFWAGMTIHIFA